MGLCDVCYWADGAAWWMVVCVQGVLVTSAVLLPQQRCVCGGLCPVLHYDLRGFSTPCPAAAQIKQLATTPWQLGKPFHGRAKVSAAPQQDAKAAAAASALVKAAARNAAAAAAGSAGGSASAAALAIGSAGDDTAEGALLAKELGGQILAIPDDFFLYQFVYRSHIRQFHEEAGKVTEDWSLGRWALYAGGLRECEQAGASRRAVRGGCAGLWLGVSMF